MLKLFENKKFLFVLLIINVLAGLFSISYYFSQLQNTNPLLWLFVIDCPLYAIFFGLILYFRINDTDKPWLSFIVIVGMIKFGLWTIFVLWQSNLIFDYWLFALSHFLMIVQTIVFFRIFTFKVKHVLLAVVWFITNDFFDYVLLTHPFFIGDFQNVFIFAVLTSILLPFIISIAYSNKEYI